MVAGLDVPDGIVIPHGAFVTAVSELPALGTTPSELAAMAERVACAQPPPGLLEELATRFASDSRFAVRSSMSLEDRAVGSAAGIFSSAVDVAHADVWSAIRAVWASAFTPLVAAYARATPGTAAPSLAIAVIVQRFISGQRVTIYTRPPRNPTADDVWLQRGGKLTHETRATREPLVTAALTAERVIDATDGADVELIVEGQKIWIVQARPIVHPPARRPALAPPDSLLAALRARGNGTWHWDVAHNPAPLSLAQTGLVELVERHGLGAYHLATVAGYLYAQRREDAHAAIAVTSASLLEREFARLETAMEKILDGEIPSLPAALNGYLAFYAIWADEVAPLLAAARTAVARVVASLPRERADLQRMLRRQLTRRPHSVAARIAAAARGEITFATLLDEVGDFSPAWDVATPTYREQPDALRAAIAAPWSNDDDVQADDLDAHVDARELALAYAAVSLGERDDRYFARAQAMVRRALLATAQRLQLPDDDVFWLPFDALTTDADHVDVVDLHARARAARSAATRAQKWSMPLTIGGGGGDDDGPFAADLDSWTGHGDGAVVTGVVSRVGEADAVATAIAPGAIAVARTITPSLAVWLRGARAIVSDAGDPLDHGAAIAREFSIPFVAGAAGVWAALQQGDVIEVNGDAGIIRRITRTRD